LKAYTKGEHVLRIEATVHNTRQLGCGRAIERSPQIVTRLAGMTQRFCTTLDCVTTGFLPDGTLDQLPLPALVGHTRIGGIDLNKPRIRAALAAVLALSAAPAGLHRRRPGRQGPADGRPGRLHHPPGRLRSAQAARQGPGCQARPVTAHQVPPSAARTIAALLALRDQVIGPILAGVRSPRLGRKPAHWTAIDRDYETLRIGMQALFADLGITAGSAAV
jgi:hypothetical protein